MSPLLSRGLPAFGLLFLLVGLGQQAWAARAGDGPEISRSLGKKGGIVVLWPRVSNGGEGTSAGVVQAALVELARAASPLVDVRPAPERVCPQAKGCRAVSLGAVLVEKETGCAVVATVSRPGISAANLVPWSGQLTLSSTTSPFRAAPETQVVVADFAPCAELATTLRRDAGPVTEALKLALTGT